MRWLSRAFALSLRAGDDVTVCEFEDCFGLRPAPQLAQVQVLVAAILKEAVRDSGGGKYITRRHERSGARFLRSELFVEFCDYFGIRPSVRREKLELVKV